MRLRMYSLLLFATTHSVSLTGRSSVESVSESVGQVHRRGRSFQETYGVTAKPNQALLPLLLQTSLARPQLNWMFWLALFGGGDDNAIIRQDNQPTSHRFRLGNLFRIDSETFYHAATAAAASLNVLLIRTATMHIVAWERCPKLIRGKVI